MMSSPHPFWTPVPQWLRRYRSLFLWLALVGFLAGFFVFRYGELQMGWFVLLGVVPLAVGYWRRLAHLLLSQPLPAVVVGGTLLMLLASIFTLEDPLPTTSKVLTSLANVALLMAFFAIPPLALARHKERLVWLIKIIVIVAATATLVSFIVHYGIRQAPFPADRFKNVFVYSEGLNPVLTGLSSGFAAMLALGLARRAERISGFWIWWAVAHLLLAGVFYSASRSAMLATVAGTFVMVITAPKGRRWRLAAPLLVVGLIYGTGLAGVDKPLSPMVDLVQRGDSGRMAIYGAISKRMVEPAHILMGHGLWATESLPAEEAGSLAFHAHSMYASTFFQGGLLGAIWLFAVLGLGIERAWAIWWRSGDAVWLSLLAFGMVGLLCDGTMPFRLLTITRIEPLLILFPLAFASAIGANLDRERRKVTSRQIATVALGTLEDSPVPAPVRVRIEKHILAGTRPGDL